MTTDNDIFASNPKHGKTVDQIQNLNLDGEGKPTEVSAPKAEGTQSPNPAAKTLPNPYLNPTPPQAATSPSSAPGLNLDDLLVSSPSKFAEEIENKTLQKVTAVYQAEKARNQFWDNFYTKHPHLKEWKEEVDWEVGRNFESIKKLPSDTEVEKFLIDRVNDRISTTKKRLGVTEKEIKNETASALSASGESPKVRTTSNPEPSNMAQEWSKLFGANRRKTRSA